MEPEDIPHYRLSAQHISNAASAKPEKVVFSLGAVQAQDYQAALWAVGLRCRGATRFSIEDSILRKRIIRTWPLRHTLHLVSPLDVRWMLRFYPEEPIPKYQQRNGLTGSVLKKGLGLISEALAGKKQLAYKELYDALGNTGISALDDREVQRHIIRRAGRKGIICFSPHDGKHPTFVLLEDWVPEARHLRHEDALAELALRYFRSHGPATIRDFVWWSGLGTGDARLGIERSRTKLRKEEIDGKTYYMDSKISPAGDAESSVYLLPAFDEYLLGYSDRAAVLRAWHTMNALGHLDSGKGMRFVYNNGIFLPTIIIEGQVAGTWKCEIGKGKAVIALSSFAKLSNKQNRELKEAIGRYSAFLDTPITLK